MSRFLSRLGAELTRISRWCRGFSRGHLNEPAGTQSPGASSRLAASVREPPVSAHLLMRLGGRLSGRPAPLLQGRAVDLLLEPRDTDPPLRTDLEGAGEASALRQSISRRARDHKSSGRPGDRFHVVGKRDAHGSPSRTGPPSMPRPSPSSSRTKSAPPDPSPTRIQGSGPKSYVHLSPRCAFDLDSDLDTRHTVRTTVGADDERCPPADGALRS